MTLLEPEKGAAAVIATTQVAPYVKSVRQRNRLDEALVLLGAATADAAELGLDAWQFAVEFETLAASGLTTADLRWLALKGLVQHAIERTTVGQYERVFDHEVGPTTLGRGTCVTLTPLGVRVAEKVRGAVIRRTGSAPSYVHRPVWEEEIRELRLGSHLVKRFRTSAPNQQLILSAFEEEGWPDRIDDPLPRKSGRRPKRALHDAIHALNSNQTNPLLRFFGDGSGQGVRWHMLPRETETGVFGM